jgi:hypothetical protein
MDSAAFALPAPLCGPVYETILGNARAQKTFLALSWMASSTLRDGVTARFRAPLWEVTAAAGFERMSGNAPVREGVEALRDATWLPADMAEPRRLFDVVDITQDESRPFVEWIFEERLAQMFAAPSQYALLDIRDLAVLNTSVEVMLYIQMRHIWKRKYRRLALDEPTLRRLCDAPRHPYKRLVERVRRTKFRLEGVLGEEISISPLPGRPAGSGVLLEPRGAA